MVKRIFLHGTIFATSCEFVIISEYKVNQHCEYFEFIIKVSRLSRWHSGKEASCQAGDVGSISGLGRTPGEGNGHQLQYSCLENCMDRGA